MPNDPSTPGHAAPDDAPLLPDLDAATTAYPTAYAEQLGVVHDVSTLPVLTTDLAPETVKAVLSAPDVSYGGPAAVAKALLMLAVAGALAFRGSIAATGGHLLPSTIAQAIAALAVAVFVYPSPLGSTKIFRSIKAYVIAAVPVVSVVVPFLVQYADTGLWQNLTPGQWTNVLVTVAGAVAAITLPNAEGSDNRPAKAAVAAAYHPDGALRPTAAS